MSKPVTYAWTLLLLRLLTREMLSWPAVADDVLEILRNVLGTCVVLIVFSWVMTISSAPPGETVVLKAWLIRSAKSAKTIVWKDRMCPTTKDPACWPKPATGARERLESEDEEGVVDAVRMGMRERVEGVG